MSMSKRIKDCRIAMNYTQEELANKLGLQKSAIAKYENGRVENIKRSVIEQMASVLDCTPSYLMGWDDATLTDKLNTLASANREEIDRYADYLLLTERNCINDMNKNEYIDYIVASRVNELNVSGKNEALKRITELSEINRYTTNFEFSIEPIAAHNDFANDEEQQRLMQEDIEDL